MSGGVPPHHLYGAKISYFTGKLEAYLRYKEIPFEFVPLGPRHMARVRKETGASQMPALELPDGRWLTDTTPTIGWLETQHPEPAVIPADPLQAFVSRLVEDYADEWMWRPAMHYRWSYTADARALSRSIVGYIRRHIDEIDLTKKPDKKKTTRPRDAQGRAFAQAMNRMDERKRQRKRGPEKKYKKRS